MNCNIKYKIGALKDKNHCIMGCGRSKQIQRNPRLVQPYDNNNFSNVIGGVENTSNENNTGGVIVCCRRQSRNISGQQNDIDISSEKPTIKHLCISTEDDVSRKSIGDEAVALNSRCSYDPIASKGDKVPRYISISSIDIEKYLSKNATIDSSAIDSEGNEKKKTYRLRTTVIFHLTLQNQTHLFHVGILMTKSIDK